MWVAEEMVAWCRCYLVCLPAGLQHPITCAPSLGGLCSQSGASSVSSVYLELGFLFSLFL